MYYIQRFSFEKKKALFNQVGDETRERQPRERPCVQKQAMAENVISAFQLRLDGLPIFRN